MMLDIRNKSSKRSNWIFFLEDYSKKFWLSFKKRSFRKTLIQKLFCVHINDITIH